MYLLAVLTRRLENTPQVATLRSIILTAGWQVHMKQSVKAPSAVYHLTILPATLFCLITPQLTVDVCILVDVTRQDTGYLEGC